MWQCSVHSTTYNSAHWASLSFTANSVSSAKNSVSSLWHTNNRLRGTHWALSLELGQGQKIHILVNFAHFYCDPPRLAEEAKPSPAQKVKKSLRESLRKSLRGSWPSPPPSQEWVSGVEQQVIFDSQSLLETRFWLVLEGRPGPSETLPGLFFDFFEPGRVLTPLQAGGGGSQHF